MMIYAIQIKNFRYSWIPSAGTSTLNTGATTASSDLNFFSKSSKWTAVVSDRALLNAPLYKQSCSDRGVRVKTGPVNSSTFHRNRQNAPEQELVANMTTCCPFWKFITRKPTL